MTLTSSLACHCFFTFFYILTMNLFYMKESSKQYQLLYLPSDVLLCCIAPYLCKWDQYQWFSTCTSHKSWLLQVRTVRISNYIPRMEDKMEDRHLSMNMYLWDRFLNSDRQRLLKAVGCLDSTNNFRKLRLDLTMKELIEHKAIVLDIAQYLYQFHVDNSKRFENPTAIAITRWLKVSQHLTFEIPSSETDYLQIIQKQIVALHAELGEVEEANKQGKSWNDLRGVNAVVIKNDKQYTVDLGDKADTYLQSVTFENCDTIVNVPDVPHVTLKYCKNVTNYVSSARAVHLVGMTIGDLSMLGNIKQLIVKDCKVTHYPIRTSGNLTGKGHAWEFSNIDIVDMSGLQSLDKLTLRDCKYVKDGRMLGNVQTLTIEGGSMQHYPVPTTGKGQHWTLWKVGVADVSGFASLESLTLIDCNEVTDISMLGAVRYLTIESCEKLVSTEQYPKPVGRLQEWTFKKIDMQKVSIELFCSLHHLALVQCTVSDDILQKSTAKSFVDMKWFELSVTNIKIKLSVSIIGREVTLEDYATLRSAVYLWCHHKLIAVLMYGYIQNWDVSKVKDMKFVFLNCNDFNDNISTWDVSNVTDMNCMFDGASSFNQPLNSWCVSNVTNMSFMFEGASSFNQPLGSWDVSNVNDFRSMFHLASSFNQPLNSWDVSNVKYLSYMFHNASSFNQPLGSWNVSNVTNMRYMFQQASSFNQPLNSWDVSNVTDMSYMFQQASSFNQPLNSWNVSNVTDMSYMFFKASSFNQPLNSWDVSNVKHLSCMFDGASSLVYYHTWYE